MSYSTSGPDDPLSGSLGGFGFDSPSPKAPTVGDHAFDVAARNIYERGEAREGPDGSWQRNAPSTIRQKGRDDPNHDTNAMMSYNQIRGEGIVGHADASLTYGKDDECKAKAGFAHDGQSHLRIKRPFFAFTESDADEIAAKVMEDLVAYLMRG